MMDFTGFRCQIAVDDLADIPKSLAVTLGDITTNVTVQLERSAPLGGDNRGGGDQTGPFGRRLARRVNHHGRDMPNNMSPLPPQDGLEQGETEDYGSDTSGGSGGVGELAGAEDEQVNGAGKVEEAEVPMRPGEGPRGTVTCEAPRGTTIWGTEWARGVARLRERGCRTLRRKAKPRGGERRASGWTVVRDGRCRRASGDTGAAPEVGEVRATAVLAGGVQAARALGDALVAYGQRAGSPTGSGSSGTEDLDAQRAKPGGELEFFEICMKKEASGMGYGKCRPSMPMSEVVSWETHNSGHKIVGPEVSTARGLSSEVRSGSQPSKTFISLKPSLNGADAIGRGCENILISGCVKPLISGGVGSGCERHLISGCVKPLISGGVEVMGLWACYFAPIPSPSLRILVFGVMNCGCAHFPISIGKWVFHAATCGSGSESCDRDTRGLALPDITRAEMAHYSGYQQAPESREGAVGCPRDRTAGWEEQLDGRESTVFCGDLEGSVLPRTSRRLAKAGKVSILHRAMMRKACQREGGDGCGANSSVKKLLRMGRLCGVSLDDAEVMDFA